MKSTIDKPKAVKPRAVRKKINVAVEPIKVDQPKDPEFDALSMGTWHPRTQHQIKLPSKTWNAPITTVSTVTGCGLLQAYGLSYLTTDKESIEVAKNVFNNTIIPHAKATGAGAIMATLGQSYYHLESAVLAIGFVKISEYSNYRHGADGKYKQRMYILTF